MWLFDGFGTAHPSSIAASQKRKANCLACDAWVDDDPCAAVYIETMREILSGAELLFEGRGLRTEHIQAMLLIVWHKHRLAPGHGDHLGCIAKLSNGAQVAQLADEGGEGDERPWLQHGGARAVARRASREASDGGGVGAAAERGGGLGRRDGRLAQRRGDGRGRARPTTRSACRAR